MKVLALALALDDKVLVLALAPQVLALALVSKVKSLITRLARNTPQNAAFGVGDRPQTHSDVFICDPVSVKRNVKIEADVVVSECSVCVLV